MKVVSIHTLLGQTPNAWSNAKQGEHQVNTFEDQNRFELCILYQIQAFCIKDKPQPLNCIVWNAK